MTKPKRGLQTLAQPLAAIAATIVEQNDVFCSISAEGVFRVNAGHDAVVLWQHGEMLHIDIEHKPRGTVECLDVFCLADPDSLIRIARCLESLGLAFDRPQI